MFDATVPYEMEVEERKEPKKKKARGQEADLVDE